MICVILTFEYGGMHTGFCPTVRNPKCSMFALSVEKAVGFQGAR